MVPKYYLMQWEGTSILTIVYTILYKRQIICFWNRQSKENAGTLEITLLPDMRLFLSRQVVSSGTNSKRA